VAAVYQALLHEPSLSLTDLVEHVRLPERTVRRILDQLADLQLVRQPSAGDQEVVLIPPDEALSGLLARAQADLRHREAGLRQAQEEIVEMTRGWRQRCASISRISGAGAVRDRLRRLSRTARAEVRSFCPGDVVLSRACPGDAVPASASPDPQPPGRSVAIRAICQDTCRRDPDAPGHARWMSEHGAAVRTVPVVPMRLMLVDRTVAIIPISPAEPRAGVLEIRNPSILAMFSTLFEEMWQDATPLDGQPARRENGLRPQERQVLRLLADGVTDETIARKLGVSVRTVRRTVAGLATQLNASSRFQAGLNAARAGWL
jgi:DNA-binding CsgD family transcriptional regulator